MRIDSLHVAGSLTLKNAGISEMDISFPSPIQIILGRNGCGKSLTLSYLDPTPAPTTTFANWGKREVIYETNKGRYIVSTDYSSSTSPHRFIDPDGENLNVGQTARMQEQLCETELGLNSFTIGLMMNTPTLVKRTEGQRKAYLMNIAPSSIGFILDQQKEVEKKIRDTNANIVRLQERKLQLEQDLLSGDARMSLEEEELTIQCFLEKIQKQLHFLDYEDKNDPDGLCAPDLTELTRISRSVRAVSEQARDYVALGIPPERLTEEMRIREDKVAHTQGIIASKSEQIVEIRTTLSETEQRIKALGVKSEIDALLSRIQSISDIIDARANDPAPPMMISRSELQVCLSLTREVEAALSDFVSIGTAIYSRAELSRKKDFRHTVQRRDQQYRERLRSIEGELEEIKADEGLTVADIPDPCSKMACPLFRTFFQQYDKTEKRKKDLHETIRKIHHKQAWINRYHEIAQEIFPVQDELQSKLRTLWALAQKNPVLQSLLRRDDILRQLRQGPIKIYRDMMRILDLISWSYEKNDLQSELSSAHASVSRFKAAGEGDLHALEQSILKEEKRLCEQISGLERIEQEMATITTQIKTLSDWDLKWKGLDVQEHHVAKTRDLTLKWIKRQIRGKERIALKTKQKELLGRIGDIRKVLRDQSLLQSRYDEEVVAQLTTLNRERDILSKVCHELTMAPREYMVPFVNMILTLVNKMIKTYWTQKIEFVLWDTKEDLNYQFPHYKNGNLVKDMDKGSEGERDLFTLLFNLAIRIVRQKTDLPLCLDEVGRTFDEKHKGNLVKLLTHVMDQKWATQLIIVNHDPMVHEGFLYADVIVLDAENIHTPEVFNEHVTIS